MPLSFGHWRETTVFIMLDVLKCEYRKQEQPRSSYFLQNYSELLSFFTQFSPSQHVGLLSQNTPHTGTHRRDKPIAAIYDTDVCLENGMRYQYHNNKIGGFVDSFLVTDEILIICTYTLPVQSSSLQRFLFRPATMHNGPSPNTVISSQSECPDHLSLDEFAGTAPIG